MSRAPIDSASLAHSQLTLFQSRQDLARVLLLADLYRQYVVPAPGMIFEFGTFLGRNAALFTNLRSIFEPYNFTRKIVVFDTFEGLRGSTVAKDGSASIATDGAYRVGDAHDQYLREVLRLHEANAPISHIEKFELVRGDARETVEAHLSQHPETVVACAYFDFDLYEPTLAALKAIRPHLTSSSILIFDELNCVEFPGETAALREVFESTRIPLRRSPLHPWITYTDCSFL